MKCYVGKLLGQSGKDKGGILCECECTGVIKSGTEVVAAPDHQATKKLCLRSVLTRPVMGVLPDCVLNSGKSQYRDGEEPAGKSPARHVPRYPMFHSRWVALDFARIPQLRQCLSRAPSSCRGTWSSGSHQTVPGRTPIQWGRSVD